MALTTDNCVPSCSIQLIERFYDPQSGEVLVRTKLIWPLSHTDQLLLPSVGWRQHQRLEPARIPQAARSCVTRAHVVRGNYSIQHPAWSYEAHGGGHTGGD